MTNAAPASQAALPGGRRPLHLVVADDERDMVATLSALLRDEGHSVSEAHSALSVLAQIRERLPDAVIVDINMPGVSGYDVAREARRIYGEGAPLLIAISGKYTGQTDRMLARLAGFDHFLPKPCDVTALLDLLEPLTKRGAPRTPFADDTLSE